MPEAPAAPPPAAPAAPPPPPAPALGPASIPASALPQPTTPSEPPKPGSARARMFDALRKKAGTEPAAPPAPTAQPAAPEPEPAEPETPEAAPTGEPAEPPAAPGKPKKASPWRLVDDYKAKVTELEKQVLELKSASVPEAEGKQLREKLSQAEKRNQELETHIRYVDYTKSAEFKTKYQEPYEKAWAAAMKDLSELVVIENAETGEGRQVTPQDMLQLVNMPLAQARQAAVQMFGDFADDVMAHRKSIRGLFENQAQALEEARKSGDEHFKQLSEQVKSAQQKLTATAKTMWNKANESALTDPKYGQYFKPVEGDEQGNQRLAKGFELADRAFSESPFQPDISEEERANIIRRHAAVRNRCAAFGRLVYQNEQFREQVAKLQKELEGYRASEPGRGTPRAPVTPSGPSSAKEQVFAALRAKVIPQ